METGKILLKILLNLLPVLLMSIGQIEGFAKIVLNFLGWQDADVSTFMGICFIIGVALIYIYYPFRFYLLKKGTEKRDDKLKEVTAELKKIFCSVLGKELGNHHLNLNVRKFKKRKWYKKPWKEWFNTEKIYFEVENLDYLNFEEKSAKFGFEVNPVPRGLVGVAFQKKIVMIDDRLKERSKEFNLSQDNLNTAAIRNVDFAIVKPFGENGNVSWLLSFDTTQNIEIPDDKKKEIADIVAYYSDLFGKLVYNLK